MEKRMTYELPEPDCLYIDAGWRGGNAYFSETVKRLTAAAEQRGAAWQDAVIEQLVVAHIYRKEHATDPRKALQDLISWHVQVALDPQVSSDAQALVDRGAEAMQEKCVTLCMTSWSTDDERAYGQELAAAIRGLK